MPAPGTAQPKRRFRLGDPLSIVLILVIVVAVVVAGIIVVELYARNTADKKVAEAAQCVAQDNVTASFSAMPPFLWQHINGHYTNISISTAGNQIKSAKGMKAVVSINDVDLNGDANSKGNVTTKPSDGTISLDGTFGSIVAKPQVANNKLTLQVVSLSGLGFTLPSESVQPALDGFSDKLANDLPLGIHADSVQVTDSGVVAQFSTRNAKIPVANVDPCFAGL
jgi:hypothetical protein